jgi:hypothetical protein
MKQIRNIGLLIIVLLAHSNGVFAFVIGDNESFNCHPFGCDIFWTPEYQQVFDASYFSGVTEISSLSFYNTVTDSGNYEPNTGTYSLSLSTTSALVDNLSTTPADNIGANNAIVYTGELTSLGGAFGGRMDIILDQIFSYDSSMGNLLLSVTAANLGSTGLWFDMTTSSTDGMSRFFGTETDTWALVTGFNEAAVPEPSSLVLLSLGILGIGFAHRKKNMRKP